MMQRPELSIVIPFFNEEAVLPQLREALSQEPGLPASLQVVLVNDGSHDGSAAFVARWAAEDRRIVFVSLSRNFGHQAAISAGLQVASGQWVGIMDADLQDSPDSMVTMWQTACQTQSDVVYCIRVKRKESILKRAAYSIFYRIYHRMSDTPTHIDSGDFCVMSRRFVTQFLALPENVRFVRGLRSWVGMKQTAIVAERQARAGGEPKYTMVKLFKLAFGGLIGFSTKPLYLSMLIGMLSSGVAILLALVYLFIGLFTNTAAKVPGFTTVIIFMLFMHGLTFVMIGIVGQYVAQIFLEVKRRPTYIIDHIVNAPEDHSHE